jgi:hypothetical protein
VLLWEVEEILSQSTSLYAASALPHNLHQFLHLIDMQTAIANCSAGPGPLVQMM